MPALVAIPQIVDELLVQFGDFFPNEPARRHIAEYLAGLFVAEQKMVSGGLCSNIVENSGGSSDWIRCPFLDE